MVIILIYKDYPNCLYSNHPLTPLHTVMSWVGINCWNNGLLFSFRQTPVLFNFLQTVVYFLKHSVSIIISSYIKNHKYFIFLALCFFFFWLLLFVDCIREDYLIFRKSYSCIESKIAAPLKLFSKNIVLMWAKVH